MAKCTGAALVSAIQRMMKRDYPNVRVRKLADAWTRGYPDLQMVFVVESGGPLLNGDGTWHSNIWLRLLEVECKAGSGKLSDIQRAERDKMRKVTDGCSEYKWLTANSAQDVADALEEMGCKKVSQRKDRS